MLNGGSDRFRIAFICPTAACTTSGIRTQAVSFWSRVAVGVGDKGGIPDHPEDIALIYVVRLDELAAETSNEAG